MPDCLVRSSDDSPRPASSAAATVALSNVRLMPEEDVIPNNGSTAGDVTGDGLFRQQHNEELAHTDQANAQAKQALKDTTAALADDEEFLMMLKKLCTKVDGEHAARTKERNMEIEACSKSLAVLASDEVHDAFTNTFNFLQTSKSSRRAVAKTHDHAMCALAMKVRLDVFEKVKNAIVDMVAALTQQKADEIKHKDFRVEEFNQNQLAIVYMPQIAGKRQPRPRERLAV